MRVKSSPSNTAFSASKVTSGNSTSVTRSPMPGPVLVLGVADQPVRVRALDAVHPAGIFGLGAVEEARRRAARGALQVGHFQRVEVAILGEGDLGLAAEAEALQGHAVRAVGVRGDHDAAGLVDQAVRGEHVGASRRPPCCPRPAGRPGTLRRSRSSSSVRSGVSGGKMAEDVEPERGGKLEARQHQDLVAQAAVLIQIPPLLGP